MANELKHGSVGTELTQAEWEAVGTHVFDSQATGDIVYASSSSQLSRLGVGSNTNVLTLASGIPSWAAPAAAAAGSLTGSTLASGVTASSLTSVGTIATGVWQGTDVGVAYGGTGVSTLTQNGVLVGNGSSAIGSIDMSTKGHVLIGDGSGNPQMLGVGTNTHVLTADSGETTGVKWAAPAAAAAGSLTGSTLASGVTASSLTSVGALSSGTIASGFGSIVATTVDATTDFTIGNTILTSELLNVATGGITIGVAGSAPSPDGDGVHIWDGTAGSVTANAGIDMLVLESGDANLGISLLATNSTNQFIAFGAPQGNLDGFVRYSQSNREFAFGALGATQVLIDEKGITVNTVSGVIVSRSTTDPTSAISLFNGTAPVGTLANGVTLYSASGELLVMDAAGNATTLS